MAKEYPWSPYQYAVFDFVQNRSGNAVVNACAGSGKTTTLVKCLDFIPNTSSVLLTAFNKDIVEELQKRTKHMPNVSASTLHSIGLRMLHRRFTQDELELDEFKYHTYIRKHLKDLSDADVQDMSRKQYMKFVDNIKQYVDFGRCYLAVTRSDMNFIEDRYGIDTIADEKNVALKVINWGVKHLSTIDFTDMVALPNYMGLVDDNMLYDFVLCDEVQDLNRAQRELVLRCRKEGARMVSFGDKNQMLYSFSGSDFQSFATLQHLPDTITLPLSISYRCAKTIVEYAQHLVPEIEYCGDGREGEIVRNASLTAMRDGDMVLCRNNAPLMQVYNSLIAEGRKAFIRGKDIGSNMKRIVSGTHAEKLSVKLDVDGVFPRLYADLFERRNLLMARKGIDRKTANNTDAIQARLDMIRALEVLSDGTDSTEELEHRIDNVFSDKNTDGIALSTIHKAKGLEADRVWIVCDSLMPSKNAKKDWEIEQEYNLMYVAYTRAKNLLGFISEKEVSYEPVFEDTLQNIERIVSLIAGLDTTQMAKDPRFAKEIIDNVDEISASPNTRRAIPLGVQPPIWKMPKQNTSNAFTSIMNNGRTNKKKRIW